VIPNAFLQAWSTKAPWPDLRQVEQDLIICRALCDLFNAPALAGKSAFRGGTAIHKLLLEQPLRYSEDIDLVQADPEPIGGTVDAIRAALSWLGNCSRAQAGHLMHLVFQFRPEIAAQATLELKVEINTREHASLLGVHHYASASICGNNRVVFNVGGNRYRLVVEVQYQAGIVWVKFVGTHAQYDRIDVETVNDY